ncbi:MAG: formylglycine-generating enzyme family protein [Planctomycetota bacterium]
MFIKQYVILIVIYCLFTIIGHAQTPISQGSEGRKEACPDALHLEKTYTPPDWKPVPAGEYEMGDHFGVGYTDELPVHAVYIDAFEMSVNEVTNKQYCTFLNSAYAQGLIDVITDVVYKAGGTEIYCDTLAFDPDSRIYWDGNLFAVVAGKKKHPMLEVSWFGAVAYANWLSNEEGLTPCYDLSTWEFNIASNGYRLPTEAEWEKAARGGEHNPYCLYSWGNDLEGSKANYWNSGDPFETGPYPWTSPVGYFNGHQSPAGSDMANEYGLYDMCGNLWEWCNDWYGGSYYSVSPFNNPEGPATGSYRILRGGSWSLTYSVDLRCALRYGYEPDYRGNYIGFRVVRR